VLELSCGLSEHSHKCDEKEGILVRFELDERSALHVGLLLA